MGDAATEAFRMWVSSKRQNRLRNEQAMSEAAREMDRFRLAHRGDRSGAAEIRRWRDKRKSS